MPNFCLLLESRNCDDSIAQSLDFKDLKSNYSYRRAGR